MDDEYFFRPSWMEVSLPTELPKRFHFRNLVFGYMDTLNPNSAPPEPPANVYYDPELNEMFIVNVLPTAKLAIINTDGHLFHDRYVFDLEEFEKIKKLWEIVGDL